jgi:hypothetical protein
MKREQNLPGLEGNSSGSETRWFTPNSCVIRHGDFSEVFVGGMLVGRYGPKEIWARNILLVGLAEDQTIKRGKLAWAFGLTAERLRQLRKIVADQGVDALPGRPRGGSTPKVSGKKKA